MVMVVVVVVMVVTAIMVMFVMIMSIIMVMVMMVMIVLMLRRLCLEILVRLKQTHAENQRQWHLGFCRSEHPGTCFDIPNPHFQGVYIGFIYQIYLIEQYDV